MVEKILGSIPSVPSLTLLPHGDNGRDSVVVVDGEGLTVGKLIGVARQGAQVRVADEPEIRRRIQASCDYVAEAVSAGRAVYGVTSGFGGMANHAISREDATELQNNLIWFHKTGTGRWLPESDVRASMLLRINSLMQGASGVRLELIERLVRFLNANVTPLVYELGSIGASGDLVPLTYICGALIGLDRCFEVNFDGERMDALTALERLDLSPLRLWPKEGLAMINGTSVMTGIAAGCVYDAYKLVALALGVHALAVQALKGTNQSFHPFTHGCKPHPGQVWVAERMLELLDGSDLIRNELNGEHDRRGDDLLQDRYSLRCLPQYLGPVMEGLAQVTRQIEVEMNSATDNPLIDGEKQMSYHGGNFLGQYVGVAMDHLRYYIGLVAKHLDVQIASLVSPEFNNGLPPSLRGNSERRVNMGLKGLQITANSIMPLLTFLGNSLVDRFPTHAEQYNQNVNSQGFGSANLARQATEMFCQYIAIALMFGVQAVDLRTYAEVGHYDAQACMSPATARLYEAVRTVVNQPPSANRPYVWNDNERPLDVDIAAIAADIAGDGSIPRAVREVIK
jgi:phenylalanine ammonia-lyase